MCGIHAVISKNRLISNEADLEQRLQKRGPDHIGRVTVELQQDLSPLYVTFTSTVLSLRGDQITPQPLIDNVSGSVLCWNGEAWKIRGQQIEGNDGQAVLTHLVNASKIGHEAILDALRTIEGPFAFVYLDKSTDTLYFGRDRLGRRSLLSSNSTTDGFRLSSISGSPGTGWEEVEADGFYGIRLSVETETILPTKYEWVVDDSFISGIGQFNTTLPDEVILLTCHSAAVRQLQLHLTESLRLRVLNVPVPPKATSTDARIAVLFSGGLDCTVLARILSDLLPSEQVIDLLNVAFENPRIASLNQGLDQDSLYEMCPDRVTGRQSFAELLTTCPQRRWRFVTVNVPYHETTAHRSKVVDLIYPHNTEMDLSIAYALYFAARGQGTAYTSTNCEGAQYQTTARVLLSGLGADELFGGYIRHSTAFQRNGYTGLIEELKLDVSRLGKRNLGRDDRVMAHWGREVRFPYLDETFVKWAIESPVWEKCDFGSEVVDDYLEAGKRVLRLLAQEVGLECVAKEKKRAIQFGARTAKMESGKVKGTTLIS